MSYDLNNALAFGNFVEGAVREAEGTGPLPEINDLRLVIFMMNYLLQIIKALSFLKLLKRKQIILIMIVLQSLKLIPIRHFLELLNRLKVQPRLMTLMKF